MRADRLLSILLLLQARGRMTAKDLAEELEVSERTIYRDIDALSSARVPVYGQSGPDGGYSLLDSYRTDLTGLTEDEVRALFMLSVPEPLAELGMSQNLKAALLKLAAALSAHRHEEKRARQRFHLDSTWWHHGEEAVPHLQTIHPAVWQDRRLYIRYQPWHGAPAIERLVDPYGLVAKAGIWHLACARSGRIRVYRVSHLLDARVSDESFERPAGFDLSAFWQEWCAEREKLQSYYAVTVRVGPDFVSELPRLFGERIREAISQAGPPDRAGWITLVLPFESLVAARERILGFGGAVEVLKPPALRKSVVDYATQIVALYAR